MHFEMGGHVKKISTKRNSKKEKSTKQKKRVLLIENQDSKRYDIEER